MSDEIIKMPIREFLPSETPVILQKLQTALVDNTAVILEPKEIEVILESMTQLIQTLGKTSMVLQQVLEDGSISERKEVLH